MDSNLIIKIAFGFILVAFIVMVSSLVYLSSHWNRVVDAAAHDTGHVVKIIKEDSK